MNDVAKKISPPYLSLQKLEKTLDLASSRNLSSVTSSMFRTYGYADSDAILAVNLLKFLGLISADGAATEMMQKMHLSGDAKRSAMDEIVRSAYTKLFSTVKEPQNLSQDELSNEFVLQYSVTPRTVRGAVIAFLKLCEFAGLRAESSTIRRSGSTEKRSSAPRTREKKATTSHRETVVLPHHGAHLHPIVKDMMVITIPEELFLKAAIDDELNDDWRKILKAAHAFADKYISKVTDEVS